MRSGADVGVGVSVEVVCLDDCQYKCAQTRVKMMSEAFILLPLH